ncbi:MAG: DUF6503 family protein [Candidatus Cyclobacteriaceae bacterium M2_1C_046]
MKKYYFLILLAIFSCKGDQETQNKAQTIIDQAIEKAGGERFQNAVIEFDFRNMHYRSERKGGLYTYYRIQNDSIKEIKDKLNNEGFSRLINEEKAVVHDTMAVKYSSSINSVIYFALLPYGLNDEAVNKEYLEQVTMDDRSYHKIKVTFEEEGGGEDFEDIFIYWINKDSLTVDYLAYEYHTEGGGQRFRKAINPRYINGIRFVDYLNYKPVNLLDDIAQIDSLYKNDSLKFLSEIKLTDINVELLTD